MSLALAVLRDKMISARTRRERALAVAWRPLSAAAVRHGQWRRDRRGSGRGRDATGSETSERLVAEARGLRLRLLTFSRQTSP